MNDDFEKKNENSPEEDLPGESIASSEENAQETGAFDAKTESASSQANEEKEEQTAGSPPQESPAEEHSYTFPSSSQLDGEEENSTAFVGSRFRDLSQQGQDDKKSSYAAFENQQQQYRWQPDSYQASDSPTPPPKKSNTGLKVFAAVMSALFLCTAVAFAGFIFYQKGSSQDPSENDAPPINEDAPQLQVNDTPSISTDTYSDGGLSTEAIAEKVRPSVVGISNYARDSYTASSAGSGIIMSEDGYIITNSHVVSGAYALVVTLDDGTEYTAQLIGADEKTDLAVIKIDAEDLPVAEFGDSDQLAVGERIVAIGNPTGLNLAGSTTQGIVSGLQRSISITNEETNTTITMEVIQVDAAINPGNSGGALVNKYGQVVGINTAKITSTNVEGIGFAIPIDTAKPIIDDLLKYGYVTGRPLLGITYVAISDEVAEIYHYTPGLQVYTVAESSDAYAKGLREGDVITQMDGIDVRDSDTVRAIMAEKSPGDTLTLTVVRTDEKGSQHTFTIEAVLSEDKGTSSSSGKESSEQREEENNDDRFSDIPSFQLP